MVKEITDKNVIESVLGCEYIEGLRLGEIPLDDLVRCDTEQCLRKYLVNGCGFDSVNEFCAAAGVKKEELIGKWFSFVGTPAEIALLIYNDDGSVAG